jgi:hypothetical protein
MNTIIRKDCRGNWKADTRIEFDAGIGGDSDIGGDSGKRQVLEIHTGKNHRGELYTSASVHKIDGAFSTFVMFQDFHKVMVATRIRCTEKAVKAQHDDVLSRIASIKQYAKQHYSDKEA